MARKSNDKWEINVNLGTNWQEKFKNEIKKDLQEMTQKELKKLVSKMRNSAIKRLDRLQDKNLLGMSQGYHYLAERQGLLGKQNQEMKNVLPKISDMKSDRELLIYARDLQNFLFSKTNNIRGVYDYMENLKAKPNGQIYRDLWNIPEERKRNALFSELHNILLENSRYFTSLDDKYELDSILNNRQNELEEFFKAYEPDLLNFDTSNLEQGLKELRQKVEDILYNGLKTISKNIGDLGNIGGTLKI